MSKKKKKKNLRVIDPDGRHGPYTNPVAADAAKERLNRSGFRVTNEVESGLVFLRCWLD